MSMAKFGERYINPAHVVCISEQEMTDGSKGADILLATGGHAYVAQSVHKVAGIIEQATLIGPSS